MGYYYSIVSCNNGETMKPCRFDDEKICMVANEECHKCAKNPNFKNKKEGNNAIE